MKRTRANWWSGLAAATAIGAVAMGAAWAAGEPDSTRGEGAGAVVDLSQVRDRAETMPIDLRNDVSKRIGVTVERVNNEARDRGQTAVAARLASEFGLTVEALLDEKGKHGLSWGEMVIAHTLLANAKDKVTLLDLMSLRADGLGWGAIAYGLRFHLEDLEDAIKAEGRVAMGLSKPDGKAAVIGK